MTNDIASILDSTLDDLADLPAFQPFPVGSHRATIHFSVKEVNKSPAVELEMKAIETVELADAADQPVKAGDTTNVLFQLDNEFGQGKLKDLLKVLGASFAGSTSREIMEAANGAECLITTKIRVNKNNKDQRYTDIVNLQVL